MLVRCEGIRDLERGCKTGDRLCCAAWREGMSAALGSSLFAKWVVLSAAPFLFFDLFAFIGHLPVCKSARCWASTDVPVICIQKKADWALKYITPDLVSLS